MNHNRPLDDLLPELRSARAVPTRAVHPRVLEVSLDTPVDGRESTGRLTWAFAVWSDPGDVGTLHQQLKRLVEATLLQELSAAGRAERAFDELTLFVFEPLAYDPTPALRPFGFQRSELPVEAYAERLATLRDEALSVGVDAAASPDSVWVAPIARHEGSLGEQLREIDAALTRLESGPWGSDPGAPSKRAAEQLQSLARDPVQPDLAGLDTFELLLTQRATGVIRWLSPALFRAVCDFIGVIIHSDLKRRVDWALCEPDNLGFTPPPLLRIAEETDKAIHLPVGIELLRWWVMPLQPGEEVPPLSAWLSDQLGAAIPNRGAL